MDSLESRPSYCDLEPLTHGFEHVAPELEGSREMERKRRLQERHLRKRHGLGIPRPDPCAR
jgi:hypothetical protein